MPPITITTDFGARDPYVAAMKGVLLCTAPEAQLVDVTHEVPAQDVMHAAFVLRESYAFFPPGTVHLAVIDPGVGTSRRAIALRADGHYFVGPDNGLFALVLEEHFVDEAVVLDRPEYWRSPDPAATFHGRDIFAPVAAYLARGFPLQALGSPLDTLRPLRWPLPIVDEEGVRGIVLHIDQFGNCITNVRLEDVATRQHGRGVRCYVGSASVHSLHRTYADVPTGEPLLLSGSAGLLEVAVNSGNAAELLDIHRGAPITLVFTPPGMNAPSSESILKHLARVYAFAQLVTPDPAAATRLVRATFQRALDDASLLPEGDALRLYLYRLLLDIRREERGERPTAPPDEEVRRHEAPDDLASSRERHATRLVDLHLPPALVSLDTPDRLLLMLCDVEGLPCEEAAHVLEIPATEACEHHAAARATLRARMLAAVSEHERQMLDEILTDDRLRTGIAAALQDELAPLPPTLRPQIAPPEAAVEVPDLQPPDPFQRWIRTGYLALLVFALAIAAYLLLQRTPLQEETNLIVLAAQQAADATVTLDTDDDIIAEAFVEDHAGWQLALPEIDGYRLQGVGLSEIVPGVTLPVFRYAGADSARITLFALNYSLLDQAGGRVTLEPDVLEQLEDDTHFELHDIEGTQVLLWRNRDDLFLAVTPGSDPSLRRRIQP